jgi:hypothetical protein
MSDSRTGVVSHVRGGVAVAQDDRPGTCLWVHSWKDAECFTNRHVS